MPLWFIFIHFASSLLCAFALSGSLRLGAFAFEHEHEYEKGTLEMAEGAMEKPRLCVFDVGGVLVRIQGLDLYRAMPGFPVHKCNEEVFAWFEGLPAFLDWETGRGGLEAFARATIEGMGLELSVASFGRIIMEMLREPVPGMDELLGRTAARVTTVALSNVNAQHWPVILRDYPALRRFHRLFASHEIGLRKPDPACFRHVLAACGVEPAETLFFDDTPLHVAAARALGMHAVRFRDAAQCEAALVACGVLERPGQGAGGASSTSAAMK